MYIWAGIPVTTKKLIKSKADPVVSPTSPGGLFAISKQWWEYLGKYDPGFEVWGGENLELSFKTWMCGGKMEILPCSHVGHVFRTGSGYSSHVQNHLAINQKRLAEVWMDEYRDIAYKRLPHLQNFDAGDVSGRKALRKRLRCLSFGWYLKNILPEKYIPALEIRAGNGLITSNQKCVDTMHQKSGPVQLYSCCHYSEVQQFELTHKDEIRVLVDLCLEADVMQSKVSLATCSGSDKQQWIHLTENQPIKSQINQKFCLSYKEDYVILDLCRFENQNQKWSFKKYYDSNKQL